MIRGEAFEGIEDYRDASFAIRRRTTEDERDASDFIPMFNFALMRGRSAHILSHHFT